VFIPIGRQTDQHHPSGRCIFSVRTLHCVEKLLFQLASVRTSQQPVRTSISDRSASDSYQVQYMGRLTHRLDAIINKARIEIQISPSGRQSALVRTRMQIKYGNCRFDFNRLDVFLSWSGRTHSRYGNCVLKNCHPDVHPPWSALAKPYMKITCSGRATVWTSVSHRLDAGLK
jgi:cell division FtsZ-interacting protein ZapD